LENKEDILKKKFMLVITHSTDDLDRSNAAIALALSLLSEDADLALFFIFQGALMAKKGVAETIHGQNFAPVSDMWPEILDAGVPMYLCGACAKTYNITENDLVPGVKIVQIPTLASEMMDRETITW
jgi:predicted peroxiredoxin